MAVRKILNSRSLAIEIESGTDSSGNTTYKKRSFSHVKEDASLENIMDVAFAIKAILSVGIKDILLNDSNSLVNEAE